MSSSAQVDATDTRVRGVRLDDELTVALMDGRTITVPLTWFPRLLGATQAERDHWQLAGAGHGIHWPDLDEDLSTEGLLRGSRPPPDSDRWRSRQVRTDP